MRREQRVLVDGESSNATPVKSGVLQGTVLGPLMFLVYINDILDLQFDFLLMTVLPIILLQLYKMQNTYKKIYKYYLNGPSYGK